MYAYCTDSDTYSFAILLWEMMALKPPFELYTLKLLQQRVYDKDGNGEQKRPFVPDDWPHVMKDLLEAGWSADISHRPTMAKVQTKLRKECVRVRDGDESGLEHNRRRSTHVYQAKKK